MRRRTRSRAIGTVLTQDPGKDLFAYLFLLIMVFAFMLLMSFEQQQEAAQAAPVEKQSGQSGLAVVSGEHVALLEKQGDSLLLRFGNRVYDPMLDFSRLEADGHIVTIPDADGRPGKFLYIQNKSQRSISLMDYLDTFKVFSRHGVSVAFAEVVR